MYNPIDRICLLAALLLAVGAGGCSSRADAQQEKKAQGANALPVSVTTPRNEALARTLVATGSINPWQEAIIGPEVGGYRVAAVNVDVGDKVRKGQELVRLSADMLKAEVASKRAAHRQAQAQLVNASAALHRAESIKARAPCRPRNRSGCRAKSSRRARASRRRARTQKPPS